MRRTAGGNEYRAKVRIDPGSRLRIGLSRVVAGVERAIVADVDVPGLTAVAGHTIRLRARVIGNGQTTLRLRAWDAAGREPANWQITATDNSAALQQAGWVGFRAYLSGTITNSPSFEVDDYVVDPA